MKPTITRPEAVQRLKIACSHVNNAISEAREGDWRRAVYAVEEAVKRLESVLDCMGAAANGQAAQEAPQRPPNGAYHALGYRPQAKVVNTAPPAPISKPKTPQAKPKPRVLVTPPPLGPTVPSSFEFDLARMAGTDEYLRACFDSAKAGAAWPALTDAEWNATEAFEALSKEDRDKITKEYRYTKKPVKFPFT